MNPTSKPFAIQLAGKRRELYFDLNTFSAFEEVTGKFFFDFLVNLQGAIARASRDGDGKIDPQAMLEVLRAVSLKDVRALVWAALHGYDADDTPQWPMTLNQVGRAIDVSNLASILPSLMQAGSDNMPDVQETGPSVPRGEQIVSPPGDGGPQSGPSDESILGSLERSSDA